MLFECEFKFIREKHFSQSLSTKFQTSIMYNRNFNCASHFIPVSVDSSPEMKGCQREMLEREKRNCSKEVFMSSPTEFLYFTGKCVWKEA